ncbi:hypothetical protein BJX66DRAFT_330924 [Aspergillus keveii]|uniref:Uncharacterized protein n=1 Tax=Aspergillus keveii TaxID=714993 RepID=A0ABR4FI97_9EURO
MGYKFSVTIIQRNLPGFISECGPDKSLTTRLFFAIASPLAMAQLQELLGSMRQNNYILPVPELDSGSGLIAYIRTRLHLIDLQDSYQAFTDSETIPRITSERFPLLDPDALEYRQFGKSIVYFLSSRGEFEILNTMHVNFPSSQYKMLTSSLESNGYRIVAASFKSVPNKWLEF